MHKIHAVPFRKDRYGVITGIGSVLVALAVILAPAHAGDAESFAVSLGLPLPAFGTELGFPSESECKAPAVLPNLTFAESDIMIAPVATIRHSNNLVLVTANVIAVHEVDGRAYALVMINSPGALQIINVTDPPSPVPVRTVVHGGNCAS